MSIQQFIKKNKHEIDQYIKSQRYNCRLNNSERVSWILNDYSLYTWAQYEGVNI